MDNLEPFVEQALCLFGNTDEKSYFYTSISRKYLLHSQHLKVKHILCIKQPDAIDTIHTKHVHFIHITHTSIVTPHVVLVCFK